MEELVRDPFVTEPPRTSDSVRVQILATEHWGQLSTRAMIWNESFSRAGVLLTTLSAATVAIALVAQASDFGAEFRLFAVLVLPVVLFLGIATHLRMIQTLELEAWTVIAMNRLRHAYIDIAPDLEPYFMTSYYDDFAGIHQSFGPYTGFRPALALSSTATIVAVINAMVAGVLAALLVDLAVAQQGLATAVGVLVGLAVAGYMGGAMPYLFIRQSQQRYVPKFPRPSNEPSVVPGAASAVTGDGG
jgi:hypothetical protein